MTWEQQWPYRVTIAELNWDLVESWCRANIGEFDRDWYKLGADPIQAAFHSLKTIWLFRRERDAVAFALRWR